MTAVLQHGSSAMFLASSSIFVRPSPPLQQQQRMQFAAPLYRCDVQQPPMSLVPHLRSEAPAAEDADGGDGGDGGDSSGNRGGAGHDDNAAAYAALKGDPVSGGGMKVMIA